MNIKRISSLSSYHNLVNKNTCPLYRGVSNSKYKLIPRIGRHWKLSVKLLKGIEILMLDQFKNDSYRHLEKTPNTEIELLSIAQHYGAATRLLDWTKNALVALYFACRENKKRNGAVYFSLAPHKLDTKYNNDPFSVSGTMYIDPLISTERIANQKGMFTITSDPTREINDNVFLKVIIKASSKDIILSSLNSYGINEASLFPGLEGAARESNYLYKLFEPIESEDVLRTLITYIEKENEKKLNYSKL